MRTYPGVELTSVTNSNKSVATSSTEIVAANRNRNYLCLVNSGSNQVFLGLGAAAVADKGVYLAPNGGSFEINQDNLFQGVINGIAITGASNVTIVEA